ncbi:MAG: glutamate--tRNA ligase [Bacteriovoracaceae bacterium]|nr:glutamate--tRNA ligase [Bacteriovoracaceae bacterium]
MSIRVRFAPSPTGYLHIGGARTALYNYLFAKANGGQFIVRVEDTDQERSSKEYEVEQLADLKWLGIDYDIGPGKEDEFGPYRQSERLDIYKAEALKLVEQGKAFYDFCSEEELEQMREKSMSEGAPAYTGKWREPKHWDEAKARIANGEKAPIRFLAPEKDYTFEDKVRGEVTFPKGMVGDFVILRSNEMPVYNFCNVVDDHMHKITHVIRGEDHVNNTLRQLMIYEALEAKPPIFAHVSLLIGKDRQKLSKRHGATSVTLYKEESYLPQALANYLCLLGWSHPDEKDIFGLEELYEVFNLDRFSKSHAIYDTEKLKWMNGQHLKNSSDEVIVKDLEGHVSHGHFFHKQNAEWKQKCVALYKEKIDLYSEFETQLDQYVLDENVEFSDEAKEALSWETTPQIREYLVERLNEAQASFIQEQDLADWMNYCKKELKIKGKPLFMGFRVLLTGQNHGPDLKVLISLTPVHILKKRLEKAGK